MRVQPRPGDFVQVKTSDDCLIEVGSYGVACGMFKQPIKRILGDRTPYIEVTFNPTTPYRDNEMVTASGGPVRWVPLRKMKNAHRYKKAMFWNFGGHMPSAGGGKQFTKRVRVFEVYLKRR